MARKMESEAYLDYLCRVCAANTMTKNAIPECVYILQTPSLKDKIQKHLYLLVSEFDPLPKVLCKSCFRHIEAIAALTKIAVHTQKVFTDYILVHKSQQAPGDNCNQYSTTNTTTTTTTTNTVLTQSITNTTEEFVTTAPKIFAEDVVPNVSLTDPQVKDTKQKIAHASKKRTSFKSKFNPKSAAQNAYTTSTPKTTSTPTKQHQQQVKSYSSGGYVIGDFGPMANSNMTAGYAVPCDGCNVLQQKRINLKAALTNVATTSKAVVGGRRKFGKMTKTQLLQHNSDGLTDGNQFIGQSVAPQLPAPVPTNQQKLLPHNILLGNVIRDVDLLKLILKALKWPWNKLTLEFQLARLKNTSFAEVMTDPNLLQDTDLTQILGPLLLPTVIMQPQSATKFEPQQIIEQFAPPQAPPVIEPKYESTISIPPPFLAATISYKLPAETSVQLITVPHEEPPGEHKNMAQAKHQQTLGIPLHPQLPELQQIPASTTTNEAFHELDAVIRAESPRHHAPKKKLKQRFIPKIIEDTAIIVLSDDTDCDDDDDFVQRFDISLDPAIYPDIAENSNSNEAMLAKLNRQRAAMNKTHKRRKSRKQIDIITMPASDNIDDDIFLMVDEDKEEEEVVKQQQMQEVAIEKLTPTTTTTSMVAKKRRKTVIQAPSTSADLFPMPTIQMQHKNAEPLVVLDNNPSTGTISSDNVSIASATASSVIMMASSSSSLSTTTPSPKAQTQTAMVVIPAQAVVKCYSRKSAQKRIEERAQKQPPLSGGDPVRPSVVTSLAKMKKDSPKQGELQNTTVADADSTTRSIVKEVLIEANKNLPTSSDFDVEEQIDKITLTVEREKMDAVRSAKGGKKIKPATGNRSNRKEQKKLAAEVMKETLLKNAPKEDVAPITLRDESELFAEIKKETEGEDDINLILNLENVETARPSFTLHGSVTSTEENDHKSAIIKTEDSPSITSDTVVSTRQSRKRQDDKQKKTEEEKKPKISQVVISTRPARISKTLSKYYKAPPGQPQPTKPLEASSHRMANVRSARSR